MPRHTPEKRRQNRRRAAASRARTTGSPARSSRSRARLRSGGSSAANLRTLQSLPSRGSSTGRSRRSSQATDALTRASQGRSLPSGFRSSLSRARKFGEAARAGKRPPVPARFRKPPGQSTRKRRRRGG